MHYLHSEINEECGIFGVYNKNRDYEAARTAFFGIFSLQHRGQESAGITTTNGKKLFLYKEMGLITQIFTEKILALLIGNSAIAHTRYSTTGASVARNIQPINSDSKYGEISLAHNGDLINTVEIRNKLKSEGVTFETTNDSEVILKLISNSKKDTLEEAISETMHIIKGAYAVVVLTKEKLIAFRDCNGIRPLALASLSDDNGYAIASESCAFNTVGAKFIRDVEPGEIITIDDNGLKSMVGHEKVSNSICVFEYIYFARPDSVINGIPVHQARKRMGIELAKEHPIDNCDIVFPIPNTGNLAAVGMAEYSGVPYTDAVIKNHYINRTFIRPSQDMRETGVKMKLSPLREIIEGKKVVMVDDSIVRGTTIGKTVDLIREAGAKEVHVRIASPMYLYPCFYGIDTCDRNQLIAARMNVEEIQKHIGADSLGYLSLEGLLKAVGNDVTIDCCDACLSKNYPIPVSEDLKKSKNLFD